MGKITDFVAGWMGTYDRNETEHVSTEHDPIKMRGAVDAAVAETNLAAFSWNLRRPDGRHEEYGYLMGRLTANKKGGACYIAVRPEGSQDSREVFYIDNGVAIFRVPVQAPNFGGSTTPASAPGGLPPNELVSPSDAYRMSIQDDGNLVVYRMNPDGTGTAFGVVQVTRFQRSMASRLAFWR